MGLFIATTSDIRELELLSDSADHHSVILVNDSVYLKNANPDYKASSVDCISRGIDDSNTVSDEEIIDLIFSNDTIAVI